MSKSTVVIAATASVVALAVMLGVLATRDKQSPTRLQEREPVGGPEVQEPGSTQVIPPPPSLPAAAAPAPSLAVVAPDAGKPLNEVLLLDKLHDLGISDPPLSLKLAREALNRFPDTPNAPEFEWNAVKALFNMQRLEAAKEEARTMLWKYPDSPFTIDVDRHLLRPQPNQSIEHSDAP